MPEVLLPIAHEAACTTDFVTAAAIDESLV